MHLPNKEQYGLPMGLSSPSNSRERRQEFEKDKEKGTYKVGLWLEKTLQGETWNPEAIKSISFILGFIRDFI